MVDFGAGVIAGMSILPPQRRDVPTTCYGLREFLAHVVRASSHSGAAGLVVGQPFDVVKVRYQTPGYQGRYSSITQAFGEYWSMAV